ncbi:DUF2624 domain-containing protein [Metabacillus iocasae]|uniref:tRNA methyltransferase n=1 Tax=Priestia iocasae TaxID=2291674 RepID=A0ABS2QRA6_9BACI|nr:DUF2624 domain-containing protein [Metabacillus iocasae]MBM7701502.1 hypothetical protein [Metabacillus iocasae]
MNIIQKVVNHKVNNITVNELLKFSKQYNIALTEQQAKALVSIMREKQIDLYNVKERRELIKKIAQVTDTETAKKVNELFQQLM